jgi:hypothetical protein
MMNNQKPSNKEFITIKVVRRPWYQWIFWGLWFFLEIVFFQAAVASSKEFEARAAMVYWLLFGVFALFGITLWIIRRQKLL